MPIENIVAAAELSAVTDPVGNCMGLSCAHGARRVIIRARGGAAQRRGRASSRASLDDSSYQTRLGNAASLQAAARGFFAPVRA
ncbi:hypothetical protein [Burkholderia multivorans]|uniref:hypothetical protein n=1 Tax=Burkholderia multivorans TaxID=87883 RepID=UPI002157C10D|nr:hypothetical protein [Burkholderia multivorans]